MINREMNHRYLLVKLNYHDRDPLSVVADVDESDRSESLVRPAANITSNGAASSKGQQRAEARFRLIIGLALAADDGAALRRVRRAAPGVPHRRRRAAGDARRPDRACTPPATTLNVASGVGFIALFGVAVMNGVIMVANLNRVREQGMPLARGGAGGRRRAVAAGADDGDRGDGRHVAGGAGDRRRQRRAAQSRDGGCRRAVPATLLTLFIVPTFYFAMERWAERRAPATAGTAGRRWMWRKRGRAYESMGQGGRGRSVCRLPPCGLRAARSVPISRRLRRPTSPAIRRSRSPRRPCGAATPGGNAQRFVRDLDLPGQWWTLFHSKALNSLIDKALAANPDLQAAQAALRRRQGERLCPGRRAVSRRRRQFHRQPRRSSRSASHPTSAPARRSTICSPGN